jgi:hypothetical protein
LADPLFWLALSFLLVVVSLTAMLMAAIPAFRELGRASRSVEKFFDTLGKDLPPTLEAIRLTGLEITELTDDITEGVQGAGQVVQQVNQSLTSAQTGAKQLNTGTRSLLAGARAAWRTLTTDESTKTGRSQPPSLASKAERRQFTPSASPRLGEATRKEYPPRHRPPALVPNQPNTSSDNDFDDFAQLESAVGELDRDGHSTETVAPAHLEEALEPSLGAETSELAAQRSPQEINPQPWAD